MWSTPVDFYCERVDPSFWAEPANALTNVAFLIAAVAAFMQWRREARGDLPCHALILVCAVLAFCSLSFLTLNLVSLFIAFGSFAFHTLATRGAVLLDIIPITMFIYGYLLLALRRFM